VQATAGVPDATAGIAWLGPADSSKTVFTPVMVSAGAPLPFTVGNQAKIDRRSAYWAHRYVQNLAQLKYNAMIVDIQAASHLWEARGSALVAQIRAACSHARALREDAGSKDGKDQCPCEGETGCCRCAIQHVLDSHATNVLAATWDLADALMVKYADGGLTTMRPDGSPESNQLGYPSEWLAKVGFHDGERIPSLPGGETWGAEDSFDGPKLHLQPATAAVATSASARGDTASLASAREAALRAELETLKAELAAIRTTPREVGSTEGSAAQSQSPAGYAIPFAVLAVGAGLVLVAGLMWQGAAAGGAAWTTALLTRDCGPQPAEAEEGYRAVTD